MTAGATISRRTGPDPNGVGLVHLRRMWPEINRLTPEALAALGFSCVEAYLACGRPLIPGTVVSSIQTGGGGNYTTWAAWEAAIPANPTEAYTGQQDDGNDAGGVIIDVSNTNAVLLTMTVSAGNRFRDHASWPSCAAVEGQKARIVGSFITGAINASTASVLVEYLELVNTWAGREAMRFYGANGVGRFLLLRDSTYGGRFANPGAGSVVHNCIAYGGTYALWADGDAVNYTAYNISSLNAYLRTGTASVFNCIGSSFGAGFGGNYNMSADTTAPGTTTWKSVTLANIFVDVGAGTEDLHMQAGNYGTYLGGSYPPYTDYDIDGELRELMDIGADGKEEEAPPPPSARRNMMTLQPCI